MRVDSVPAMMAFRQALLLCLCILALVSTAHAEFFFGADAGVNVRGATCPSNTAPITQACVWSPATCVQCPGQCVMNEALLSVQSPAAAESAALQEKLAVCYAAGSLNLMADAIRAFSVDSSRRRLSSMDTIQPGDLSARRALLQATGATLSLDCPSDAPFADFEAFASGGTPTAAAGGSTDAVVQSYMTNPAALKAYVRANCTTYDVELSSIAELGISGVPGTVQGTVRLCSEKSGAYKEVLKVSKACTAAKLSDIGEERCFADANAANYFTEGCLAAAADFAGASTSTGQQFARNALIVHNNCRNRLESTCQDASSDNAIRSEINALTNAKEDIKSSSPRSTAVAASLAAAAALFATSLVL